MPPRQYKCTACGHRHIKPINDKCPFVDINQQDDVDSDIPCAQPQSDAQSTTSSDSSSVSDVPTKMVGQTRGYRRQSCFHAEADPDQHNQD